MEPLLDTLAFALLIGAQLLAVIAVSQARPEKRPGRQPSAHPEFAAGPEAARIRCYWMFG
jgi:hypothetical protein